ncbi:MAG: helix-turn-helix transcriptional regulator [Bacteroidota bacterium]
MYSSSIKLRKLRNQFRLSQQDVANTLELAQSTYFEWEKNDCDIKLEYIILLSDLFKVEIIDIVSDDNSGTNKALQILFNKTESKINPVYLLNDIVDAQKKKYPISGK